MLYTVYIIPNIISEFFVESQTDSQCDCHTFYSHAFILTFLTKSREFQIVTVSFANSKKDDVAVGF